VSRTFFWQTRAGGGKKFLRACADCRSKRSGALSLRRCMIGGGARTRDRFPDRAPAVDVEIRAPRAGSFDRRRRCALRAARGVGRSPPPRSGAAPSAVEDRPRR